MKLFSEQILYRAIRKKKLQALSNFIEKFWLSKNSYLYFK